MSNPQRHIISSDEYDVLDARLRSWGATDEQAADTLDGATFGASLRS
jgi:hypothetical protein